MLLFLLLLPLQQPSTDDLIRMLGSDEASERQAAQRALAERAREESGVRGRLLAGGQCGKNPQIKESIGAVFVELEWTATPEVPVEPRRYWRSVSDGDRFMLWGGKDANNTRQTDGAVFDGEHWTALEEADIEPRVAQNMLLTGDRLVIWSGGDGSSRYLRDGVVYDLEDGSARVIPQAPIEGRTRTTMGAFDEKVLIYGGVVDLNTLLQSEESVQIMFRVPRYPGDGAVLDLDTLTWREMAQPPIQGRDVRAVAGDGTLTVLGGHVEVDLMRQRGLQDGAVYDLASDAWETLPPFPAGETHTVRRTRHGLLAWGEGAALYDGRWTELPEPPVQARFHSIRRDRLLIWGHSGRNTGAVLDLETKSWTRIPACPLEQRVGADVQWDGTTLSVWGGHQVARPEYEYYRDGATWTLGHNEWTPMTEAPLHVRGRRMRRTTSNARYLVVWGGITPGPGKAGFGNPLKRFRTAALYDRPKGVWRFIPAKRLLSDWIRKPRFAWLGERLLVLPQDASRGVLWKPLISGTHD